MTWEYITSPEDVGWSTQQLRVAQKQAEALGSAAVLIIMGGKILMEWGNSGKRISCHSMRKSLLSSLFGIAIDESSISMAQTLEELGIDDNEPALTAHEKQATVADLLKARSGVYHPAGCQPNTNLPVRGSHERGTFWHYNNWDFNVLGTIFEQCTQESIFVMFQRRIAVPLQMEDFVLDDMLYRGGGPDSVHPEYWFRMPLDEVKQRGPGFLRRTAWQGVAGVALQPMEDFPVDVSTYYVGATVSNHPCYWFRMSARDLARFGLLFLNEGEWNEQQIAPAQWVKESTTSYSPAWYGAGYGYMWWVAVNGNMFPGVALPEGSFAALGMGGHFVVVIPAFDAVIVHRYPCDANREVWSLGRNALGRLLKEILAARMDI